MSRAGPAKAKADKNKPPASQTPVITHEIVPGKFNDHDWNSMLERDSSEDFVLDIVDEILSNTMSIIYDKYIERQLLPFTITLAKDAILQIVEWRFLTHDTGEILRTSQPDLFGKKDHSVWLALAEWGDENKLAKLERGMKYELIENESPPLGAEGDAHPDAAADHTDAGKGETQTCIKIYQISSKNEVSEQVSTGPASVKHGKEIKTEKGENRLVITGPDGDKKNQTSLVHATNEKHYISPEEIKQKLYQAISEEREKQGLRAKYFMTRQGQVYPYEMTELSITGQYVQTGPLSTHHKHIFDAKMSEPSLTAIEKARAAVQRPKTTSPTEKDDDSCSCSSDESCLCPLMSAPPPTPNALASTVKWQFLSQDSGESNIEHDPGWQEDEEPDPAVTDCWAQGCVPKRVIERPITPVAAVLEEDEQEPVDKAVGTPAASQGLDEMEDRVSDSDEAIDERMPTPQTQKTTPQVTEVPVKQKKFRPHKGPLKSAGVSRMTESLMETEMQMYQEAVTSQHKEEERPSALLNMPASCQSILRVQAGRPPGSKDVLYDQAGKVVAVVRLNPDKLPHHRVKVNYTVTDPVAEATQSKLDAMRRGKVVSKSSSQLLQTKRRAKTSGGALTPRRDTQLHVSSITPLPPPLVEHMDIAPGVTVKEGEWIRRGPERPMQRHHALMEHQAGLRPVATRIHIPDIDVSDLLDRTTPILRPLQETSPLPPIMPHPPSHPRVSS